MPMSHIWKAAFSGLKRIEMLQQNYDLLCKPLGFYSDSYTIFAEKLKTPTKNESFIRKIIVHKMLYAKMLKMQFVKFTITAELYGNFKYC